MSRTFRLGVFIVSTMSMLAVGSFLIGARQYLFASTYQIKTTFKTVAGLVEGAEVRIGGMHKGVVERIDLPGAPGGTVTVTMKLERATRQVVRADSVASIGTEGLLGNKFVEISFGSDDAAPIEPGDCIAGAPPVDMSDLVKKADDILDATKDTMGDVKASATNLKDISGKINQGQGTVGALVNDRAVFDRLNQATTQASQGAAAFRDDMEALKHNFFLRGFFNNRGYEDSTKLAEHLIKQLPKDTPLKSFQYDVKKVFADADHARLKSESSLDEAGRFLEHYPFGLAVVVASSGLKGDSAELHTLLQARAMVIRDYLVKNFKMDDTRVKTMEVGKTPQTTSDAGTIEVIVYPTTLRGAR